MGSVNHGVSHWYGNGALWISIAAIHRSAKALAPDAAARHGWGMALLCDPAALDALARHISGHADDLRVRASRLAAGAEAVRWHSTAAHAFRGDVRGLAVDMRRGANEVDEAAQALRRHAAAVRRVQQAIAAAEHAAAAAARGLEHAGRAAIGGVAHLVGL